VARILPAVKYRGARSASRPARDVGRLNGIQAQLLTATCGNPKGVEGLKGKGRSAWRLVQHCTGVASRKGLDETK
jgi:hypothetical protein